MSNVTATVCNHPGSSLVAFIGCGEGKNVDWCPLCGAVRVYLNKGTRRWIKSGDDVMAFREKSRDISSGTFKEHGSSLVSFIGAGEAKNVDWCPLCGSVRVYLKTGTRKWLKPGDDLERWREKSRDLRWGMFKEHAR